MFRNLEEGYIALMAVVIVGAAAGSIAVALLMTGTDNSRSVLISQATTQARQLAHACAEESLQVIATTTTYTGSNTLSLGQGSCTYTVTSTGSATRVIDAVSTFNNVSRKVKVYVTIGSSSISVTSWQEVADV
jgi:hypothetical protein